MAHLSTADENWFFSIQDDLPARTTVVFSSAVVPCPCDCQVGIIQWTPYVLPQLTVAPVTSSLYCSQGGLWKWIGSHGSGVSLEHLRWPLIRFALFKDTIIEQKREAITGRYLQYIYQQKVYILYSIRKLLQINKRTIENPRKHRQNWTGPSLKRISNWLINICIVLNFNIYEIKIKSILIDFCVAIRMANIKITDSIKCDMEFCQRYWRENYMKCLSLTVEVQIGLKTLKNYLAVSTKVEHICTLCNPVILYLIFVTEVYICVHLKMCPRVFIATKVVKNLNVLPSRMEK